MRNTDIPIVDMLTLRKDLYLVMSLLRADKELAKVQNMVVWTQVFHENETRRLMLWIATAMRGLLDLLEEKEDTFSKRCCGEYCADFPKSSEYPLTFRQACNSAIHAKEILPYRAPKQESNKKIKRVYTDRITVRGTHRRKTTRALIDIIKFVRIAYELSTLFEEDSYANV